MVLMKLFAGQQWRHRVMDVGTGGGRKEREGVIYGGSNMETYMTMWQIDSQQEFAV